MAALELDPWLSDLMGKECLHLELGSEPALELPALPRAESFVDVKFPVDRPALIGPLVRAGFGLVDTQVTLSRRRDGGPVAAVEPRFRAARDDDRAPVADLAGRAFRHSRFHLDPEISDATANRIKAAWAANYFAGRRGDAMVVANGGDGVEGFLQLLRARDRVLAIDLIAVHDAARGQGLARGMIGFAAARAADIDRLQVGTQIANIASLRLYEGLGFRVARANYVFHRHRGAGP